jgi:hypothetical protein
MKLRVVPIFQAEAFAFIKAHHRHHRPPQGVGTLFCIGATRGDALVGVVVIGRPVARALNNGFTAEVTRLCTVDSEDAKNASSMLYAAAWRAARAMGYERLVTYTLKDETGVSLVAAGWKAKYQTKGGSWDRPSRPRFDKHPLGAKTLWEVSA